MLCPITFMGKWGEAEAKAGIRGKIISRHEELVNY